MDADTLNAVKSMAKNVLGQAVTSGVSNPHFGVAAFNPMLENAQQAIVPGSSAMYYYAWAGGLGTLSVSNFMVAWNLPTEHRVLKGVALTSGVLAAAAAYLNFQKARSR